MHIGSFGGNFDVAEVVLGVFVLFFIGLVTYLQREANREHYPLVGDNGEPLPGIGLFGVPSPKSFRLPNGELAWSPGSRPPESIGPNAVPAIRPNFTGGPFEPTGNKLLSGTGPAAFGNRADVPDRLFVDGSPRIVPLRVDATYSVALDGPDPRGSTVLSLDRVAVGTVKDVWVDRAETVARYFEVALDTRLGGRTVLLPVPMSDVRDNGTVVVEYITGAQFADVPGLKSPNEITAREEDQICAYYGAGKLFATPARSEPLI